MVLPSMTDINYESPEPIDITIPLGNIQISQYKYLENRLNPSFVNTPPEEWNKK
jgi:hypothetical protein